VHRPPIAVVPIAGKGRGLVLLHPAASGSLICEAVGEELSSQDCDRLEETALAPFYFAHPEDAERGCLVLGEISFCNHADEPTAEVRWRHEAGVGWVAGLYARRDLPAGAELTHRYRCPPWFEVKG